MDQPDLKGYFKLLTITPNDWISVSNEILIKEEPYQNLEQIFKNDFLFERINQAAFVENLDEHYQVWDFHNTKPLSTYLYAIIAGPYEII